MVSVPAGGASADVETLTALHTTRPTCSSALLRKGLPLLFLLLSVPLDSTSSHRKQRAGLRKMTREGSKQPSAIFTPFPSLAQDFATCLCVSVCACRGSHRVRPGNKKELAEAQICLGFGLLSECSEAEHASVFTFTF